MSAILPAPLRELTGPFVQADVLDAADLYTVALIAPLLGEHDPLVQTGLAFAVRAPRFGHVGVDLRSVSQTAIDRAARTGDTSSPELSWPEPEAWLAKVAASPAVDTTLDQPERPFVLWEGLLHSRRYWTYQDRLATALRTRARAPLDPLPDALQETLEVVERLFSTADPLQRLGALVAVRRRLTLIAGGPGTGKTYTLKRTLALLHHLADEPPRVALAAPTGKAAVRMAEAVREGLDQGFTPSERDWLKGLQPTTLHRLLGFNPSNTTRFRHHARNPLPHDVVVVDEASMVDLPMMCRLLLALRSSSRLILLGDRNQLASVEAGSVFADLTVHGGPALTDEELTAVLALDPEVFATRVDPHRPERTLHIQTRPRSEPIPLGSCVVRYDTPFRFGSDSGIGVAAQAISRGDEEGLADALAILTSGEVHARFDDLHHLADPGDAPSPRTLKALAQVWRPAIQAALAWRPGEAVEPIVRAFEDVRILCAHRRGPRGVSGLNQALVRQLSTQLPLDLSATLVPGLPVIITENRYDLDLMNGDVGVVLRGSDGPVVAFLSAEGPRMLPAAQLPAHSRVLAMTIHKSQGSQFRHTVIVLPSQPSPLLSRELIYTGLTRARLKLTLVGSAEVLEAALRRRIERSSRLAERLVQA
ncbi:MAG: exodeoxyribonuclease V subunit alpha [Deltaproteobacteria bacterium]|nr:MAG: exodeoxyribonuclease V subunit alpha [Deltaproteobacteria bacterium]